MSTGSIRNIASGGAGSAPGAAGLAIGVAACLAVACLAGAPAQAQDRTGPGSSRYVPTIWVDPDGCEHWVMDDGTEGYMTPHVRRDGTPVCRSGGICGTFNADQFFASGSFRVSAAGQARLRQFFASAAARAYIITGHTDSVASDAYNLRLSRNRANAVARIAQSAGASVAEVRGFGERQPVASNATAEGRARNRRVEIICVN